MAPPEDGNALVVTANFLDDEPDLQVGDPVTLRIDGRDTASRWSASSTRPPSGRSCTRRPGDGALTREVGRAGVLMVVTEAG